MNTLLQGCGLVRSSGTARLLDGVDLELARGEITALLGPTGAGKTVLLRALARLDLLDAGRLVLNGQDAADIAPSHYRAQVMYLHQQPVLLAQNVEHELTAFLGFRVHMKRRVAREQLIERLHRLGLPESFLASSTDRLSGGERQIVCLLRLMLLSPCVLLLDEPTAATDLTLTKQIEQMVLQWLEHGDRAVVWVTHDPDQATRIGARTVLLGNGRVCG